MQRRTVDRVSDIGHSRLNHAFGDRGATRGHFRVFQARSDGRVSWGHGIVAHGHCAIVAVDRSSPNPMACDFHAKVPYKYQCSSFVF